MLGERLKQLRKENNMTQKQLAAKLFVDQTAVSYWEQEKTNPDMEKQIAIAKIFNVSIDYLLGHTPEEKSLDEQLEGIDFALYGEVKDLTDDEKQDILDFIRFKKSQRK